jgi:hypothetical protein
MGDFMKTLYPILSFVICLNLGCASLATQSNRNVANSAEDLDLSEATILTKAKNNLLTIAYLKQDNADLDVNQLTFIKSPGTKMLCTLMGSGNSCSMSFRVLSVEGWTLMSGAIYYDSRTEKCKIFRILDRAPDAKSDFESWSKF